MPYSDTTKHALQEYEEVLVSVKAWGGSGGCSSAVRGAFFLSALQ